MTTSEIIGIIWLVFLVYWVISWIGVKRDVYREMDPFWRYGGAVVVIILFFLVPQPSFLQEPLLPQNTMVSAVAIIFCAVGIAFAIWARYHLGKNWSSRPALKENHELVTSGPYQFVRHPIYTGAILAIIGTMLVSAVAWCVVLAILCGVFVHRVQREESLMTQQFPNTYPEYKKRTKALVPFIW
jgi:protein-S-isoprenylcysteine O-methyltransferase Ste14